VARMDEEDGESKWRELLLVPPSKKGRKDAGAKDDDHETTRHLSWSVNIFYKFIHTFIHSWVVLGGSLGVV
jgi:hypothetical protein